MKILVTGSSGFIGRALVRRLNSEGYLVVGVDNVPSDTTAHLCDIMQADDLRDVVRMNSPDALIHLAARIDLDEKENISGYAANIAGVENVIEAVHATRSIQRAIWTSSQLVCRIGYVPTNDVDYNADTLYGQSKIRTEEIVRSTNGAGREWCVVRPTTVWGPGMSPHYQRFLRMIKKGLYFHVGHEALWKSYSYIENIAFQYRQLLLAPVERIQGRTFYLADYEPIDLIAWCDQFQRAFLARRIPHISVGAARMLARCGDAANAIGLTSFPFNTFRLNNVLTQYQFDLGGTEEVCGPLPFAVEEGVVATAAWMSELS